MKNKSVKFTFIIGIVLLFILSFVAFATANDTVTIPANEQPNIVPVAQTDNAAASDSSNIQSDSTIDAASILNNKVIQWIVMAANKVWAVIKIILDILLGASELNLILIKLLIILTGTVIFYKVLGRMDMIKEEGFVRWGLSILFPFAVTRLFPNSMIEAISVSFGAGVLAIIVVVLLLFVYWTFIRHRTLRLTLLIIGVVLITPMVSLYIWNLKLGFIVKYSSYGWIAFGLLLIIVWAILGALVILIDKIIEHFVQKSMARRGITQADIKKYIKLKKDRADLEDQLTNEVVEDTSKSKLYRKLLQDAIDDLDVKIEALRLRIDG